MSHYMFALVFLVVVGAAGLLISKRHGNCTGDCNQGRKNCNCKRK